jgi:hypothetical protein
MSAAVELTWRTAGREDARSKARRYLGEGRCVIEYADGLRVRARVRGDGAIYRVEYVAGSWSCSCLARGRCSHLLAVGSVVVVGTPANQTGGPRKSPANQDSCTA